MKSDLFFDYAATTFLHPKACEDFRIWSEEHFSNASSVHPGGMKSRRAFEDAREMIAEAINARSDSIYFTSGATESNNLILKGIAEKHNYKGHFILSSIEHDCILNVGKYLEAKGCDITYLPVKESGVVSVRDVKDLLRDDTRLVSVMYANNEIGTIQPLYEIGELLKSTKTLFHSDVSQVLGKISVDINYLNLDFASFSAHKFYGPKGVGGVFIRDRRQLLGQMHGGGQQETVRSGTLNSPGIIAAATALKYIVGNNSYRNQMEELGGYFQDEVMGKIPGVEITGFSVPRLSNIVHITIDGVDSNSLVQRLGHYDIYVSTGSACASGSAEISHVLSAIGMSNKKAKGALRVSFGLNNTKEGVKILVNRLKEEVHLMREMNC